jgi:acyl-CoA thioesterase
MENLGKRIVEKMMAGDKFSQWLGIEVLLSEKGHCILKMKVRDKMVNGFGIAHGGICFSLADSALAFASNAHGRLCVALECSISFPVAVTVGDELTAEAKELSLTNKTATYLIEVKNQKKENVAFFKGTVYRTNKEWSLLLSRGGKKYKFMPRRHKNKKKHK